MKVLTCLVIATALAVAHADDAPAPHRHLRTAKQQHTEPKMESQWGGNIRAHAKMESQWGGNIRAHAKMESQWGGNIRAHAKMEAAHHNAQAKGQATNRFGRANMEGQHHAA